MSLSLTLAVLGLTIAAVDFFGLAHRIESGINYAIPSLQSAREGAVRVPWHVAQIFDGPLAWLTPFAWGALLYLDLVLMPTDPLTRRAETQ